MGITLYILPAYSKLGTNLKNLTGIKIRASSGIRKEENKKQGITEAIEKPPKT